MRLRLYIVICILLGVCFQACKKCIVCRNYCYQCEQLQGIRCNTDFTTNQVFDTIMKLNNCQSVNPSVEYRICDRNETINNLKNLNEYARYICN